MTGQAESGSSGRGLRSRRMETREVFRIGHLARVLLEFPQNTRFANVALYNTDLKASVYVLMTHPL